MRQKYLQIRQAATSDTHTNGLRVTDKDLNPNHSVCQFTALQHFAMSASDINYSANNYGQL